LHSMGYPQYAKNNRRKLNEFQNGGIYLVDCNRTLICGNGDELYMRLVKEKGDIT